PGSTSTGTLGPTGTVGPTGTAPPIAPDERFDPWAKSNAERLTPVLQAAMRRAAPRSTFTANPRRPGTQPFAVRYRLMGPGPGAHSAARYEADAVVSDGTRAGRVLVSIGRSDELLPGEKQCRALKSTLDPVSCRERRGPDGETVVSAVLALYDPASFKRIDVPLSVRTYEVIVTKPDGTTVNITAGEGIRFSDEILPGPPRPGDYAMPPPERATPSMTLEQMEAVALDPRLTVPARR
ncbi:MAG TPA: hypothetical protein VGR21_00230, partial [Cryptosporangiaceae bacterium]|nr:hypothetical protein [Cryptosporangiaceae bacterium]